MTQLKTIKVQNMPNQGVYPAVLTPVRPGLSCDYPEFASHCQDLINKGCSGVLLFGTTGEGPSFTVKERIAAIEALIRLGIDPDKMIVAVSCSATDDAVELVFGAIDNKCFSVLIVPPFFYKHVDEQGVIAFYQEVIRKVNNPNLRVLLYHIPQYSGVPITSTIIAALTKEFPKIVVGIKESEGNMSFVKEILQRFPGFKIFMGSELLLAEGVKLGAAGGITGVTNAYPELICALYMHGKDPQKPDRQAEIQKILEILKAYPTIPALKCLIEAKLGERWHALRPPLVPLNVSQAESLLKALQVTHSK